MTNKPKTEDINQRTIPYLYMTLPLLIKYATDNDIKEIIFNTYNSVNLGIDEMFWYHARYTTDPKEALIYLLNFDIWDYGEDSSIAQTKNILRQSVVTHINSIGACYFNYMFLHDADEIKSDPIDSKEEAILMRLKEKNINPSRLFSSNINSYEITNILHKIISNYAQNRFYYTIQEENIYKIQIDYNPNRNLEEAVIGTMTKYPLINTKREPRIIDKETNLEVSIGRQVKLPFRIEENTTTLQLNTCESFLGTHERVVKALSFDPNKNLPRCHWCNPDKNKAREKIKCDNCKNLIEELNKLKEKTDDLEFKKNDFNKIVATVDIEKVKNLATLRNKRKKLLYDFLSNNKQHIKNSVRRNQIKKLIDNSFTVIVKPITENEKSVSRINYK